MNGEPLQHLLSMVENTTPVRFRYAAPVDTLVTESFDNAPLWPSLEALLLKSGFHMKRSGESVFLLRTQTAEPLPSEGNRPARGVKTTPAKRLPAGSPVVALPLIPASWQYWALESAPPDDWKAVQPSAPPSVLMASANRGWRQVALALDGDRTPGVAVLLPPNVTTRHLRWTMKLRDIPLGSQLTVVTAEPVTFYVNGAPMYRRRSGRQQLDLSQALNVGDNCLAIEWEPTLAVAGNEPQASPPAQPKLQFEWYFSERSH